MTQMLKAARSDSAPPQKSSLPEPLIDEGKKPAVSDKLWRAARKAFRGALISAAVAGAVGAGTVCGAKMHWHHYQNEARSLPHKQDGLAILISYGTVGLWDKASVPLGEWFIPDYVARVETAFGQKADRVITRATKADLLAVLRDESIQNIVVYGHGSWVSWLATDSTVSAHELEYRFERRHGKLVRHTCGVNKMFEGLSYDGDAVREKVRAEERRLNERLEAAAIGTRHLDIQFLSSTIARDTRADGSNDGYDIQLRVTEGSGSVALGSFHRFGAVDTEILDGRASVKALTSIPFVALGKSATERLAVEEHPLKEGNLYRGAELQAIADYMNSVHAAVTAAKVAEPKVRRTLGEGIFDRENIVVVEGINYPWQWMSEPFGPDGNR